MDEYDIRQMSGQTHWLSKKEHKGFNEKNGRSANYHGKHDKFRGLRKKADRHCHHRRRQMTKIAILNNNIESIPKSTTCKQKRKHIGEVHHLSNRQRR